MGAPESGSASSTIPSVPIGTDSPSHRPVLTPRRLPSRILLAEDDSEMRRLLVGALRKDGYEIVAASDGGRLLVTVAHELVDDEGANLADLIVSDLRMPVCTGMQILEQLRAARCGVPFILMTAFGDPATRHQAHSLGALLIDKPFALDDLRAVVARVLGPSP